jgi:hypothetical protein
MASLGNPYKDFKEEWAQIFPKLFPKESWKEENIS